MGREFRTFHGAVPLVARAPTSHRQVLPWPRYSGTNMSEQGSPPDSRRKLKKRLRNYRSTQAGCNSCWSSVHACHPTATVTNVVTVRRRCTTPSVTSRPPTPSCGRSFSERGTSASKESRSLFFARCFLSRESRLLANETFRDHERPTLSCS